MQAVILSIGDELVLGQTVDTNSAFLSDQLVRLGIGTLYHQTIADDRAATAQAVVQAAQAADLVLISGGLGPTEDDLTRQALGDALGVGLVLDEPSVAAITGMFRRRGRDMPERNQVQALHPAGTQMIPNTCGTAPGIKGRLNRATFYVMPGVPSEMVVMFELSVRPEIVQNNPSRGVILTSKVNTFGLGESTVAERLGSLMDRTRNPKVGTTVGGGVVSVRVRSEFPDTATAQVQMDATLREIDQRLQPAVYGRDGAELSDATVMLLKERRQTLATAESCTGGLLGAMVTSIPGSSAVYVGGWVTYANAMKNQQLGVPADMLDKHGAVSQAVARAMARGALEKAGADVALAITGIAGPDGGTPEKPVGLVWIALAWRDDAGISTDAMRFDLGTERQLIRDRAAKSALQMLRFHLLGVEVAELTFGRRVEM